MHRPVTASVPGRVCFAGEDIDWISGPSVLGAVGLRLRVTVAPLVGRRGRPAQLSMASGPPFNVERSVALADVGRYRGHVLDYVEAAVKLLLERGVEIRPVNISVTSALPARVGLSSSAAVSVASLAALAAFHGLGLSVHEICRLACLIESQELKTGAGQMDFYVCGLGGLRYIDSATVPPSPIEKYDLPPDTAIIIADTQVPRRTADVIRVKRARLAAGEAGIIAYVEHTEAAIAEIRRLLGETEPNLGKIGALITSCHDYLDKDMRVSTAALNACVRTCLASGALGAKLTGTGMGGCIFALVPAAVTARVREALAAYRVVTYVTGISNDGLSIEHGPDP